MTIARRRRALGQVAYAALFVVVLPLLLAAWARALVHLPLPAYGGPWSASLLIGAGLLLVATGTHALFRHGGGLPMSPYPPPRFVEHGIYRYLAHPIYTGVVVASVGASLAVRSASGLWIVSPVLALSIAAYVLGFERDHTRCRFGARHPSLLALPRPTDESPTLADRLSIYGLVLLPWTVLYMAVELLGVPPDALEISTAWDRALPVVPVTEAAYVLTYPFVGLAPLVAARRSDLRRFAVWGLIATTIVIPLYLLVPLTVVAKPVPGEGFWQTLMSWERELDQAVTAFPAFHVVWSFLAANLYRSRWPRLAGLWWGAALAIAVSCVTTGMHAMLDIVAGFAMYLLVVNAGHLWELSRRTVESVANSWREWTLGGVRLMNHGIYAAFGTTAGTIVILWLTGGNDIGWVVATVLATVVGAAVWAQVLEGSSRLLRPFGYFGGVLGAIGVACIAGIWEADGWRLLAATAVGGTFAQALGRLRCLVQGCCHGRQAPPFVGIRYVHPRSRVTRLADLAGTPVHATPFYSILWCLVMGAILVRLWVLAAPLQLIAGMYLILTGVGRFVEEHYRGEPQTPNLGGLRIYQWFSIAFVVTGAVVTTLGRNPAPPPSLPSWVALLVALLLGGLTYPAYGIDFPRGNRRFTRLV